jgi:hypothetical protein
LNNHIPSSPSIIGVLNIRRTAAVNCALIFIASLQVPEKLIATSVSVDFFETGDHPIRNPFTMGQPPGTSLT